MLSKSLGAPGFPGTPKGLARYFPESNTAAIFRELRSVLRDYGLADLQEQMSAASALPLRSIYNTIILGRPYI